MNDSPTTPDPIEIAMEAERADAAPDSPARTLLVNQNRLVGWQIASERAGVALKLLTGLAGLILAGALGMMAWQGANDESIVIRAFHAPPAYGARGLDGEVLAGRFMDRLREVQLTAARGSLVRARRLADDAEGLKVEIPQTGLSLGELQQLLAQGLGRRTVISGAVSEDRPGQITLDARIGTRAAVRVTGPADQLDALILALAERTFAVISENQESIYLIQTGRLDEALAAARALALSQRPGDPLFGPAHSLWGQAEGDYRQRERHVRRAAEAAPTGRVFRRALAKEEFRLGHEAAALSRAKEGLAMQPSKLHDDFDARGQASITADLTFVDAYLHGDFARAAPTSSASTNPFDAGMAAAMSHDPRLWGAFVSEAAEDGRIAPLEAARSRLRKAVTDGDWAAASTELAAHDREAQAWLAAPAAPGRPPRSTSAVARARQASLEQWLVGPMRAVVLARTGHLPDARTVAQGLPTDCAPCQRARAWVAEAAGDRAGADAAFRAAVALSGDSPLTETAWGEALLARGDARGAIARLTVAVAKGPRYADPLEIWAEALLAQGDAKGAAAKFESAAKLASRWGRLHLKWGEALAKAGKPTEAQAKWRAAAGMDLSPADRGTVTALLGPPRG